MRGGPATPPRWTWSETAPSAGPSSSTYTGPFPRWPTPRGCPRSPKPPGPPRRRLHRLDPWPDVIGGLTRLRSRYLIGPLSNGNASLLVDLARHGGLPWDVVLGSDVYRHYKPDPEVYLGFREYFRFHPAQVMLAAAHAGDLAAGRSVGQRTAYIRRPLEHGPGRAFEPARGDFDVTAADVEDLAGRMGAGGKED